MQELLKKWKGKPFLVPAFLAAAILFLLFDLISFFSAPSDSDDLRRDTASHAAASDVAAANQPPIAPVPPAAAVIAPATPPMASATPPMSQLGAGEAPVTSPSSPPPTPPAAVAAQPKTDGTDRDIHVQVVAKTSATIGAPMAGRLVEFPLHDGDRFEQGQLLARFDCGVQEGALGRAQAILEEKQNVFNAQSRLHSLGTVSGVEYAVAQAQLHEAEADLETAKAFEERCVVKAPFAGRVAGVMVHNDQFAQESTPLLEILSDRDLELQFIVPSVWLSWLKVGTGFSVAIAETGKNYRGELTQISGKVDAVSQSINVYGRIVGSSSDLLPGMSGRVMLSPPSSSNTP